MRKKTKIFGLFIAGITLITGFSVILTSCSTTPDKVENFVNPLDGKGNLIKYTTTPELPQDVPSNKKLESIETFVVESLRTENSMNEYIKNTINNITTDWFWNIKNTKSFTEMRDKWIKDSEKEFEDTIVEYKKNYGNNWETYFQLRVLDPAGGNKSDWLRKKYQVSAASEFDKLIKKESFLNLQKADGIIPENITEKDLLDPANVNGISGPGSDNRFGFYAKDDSFNLAIADLQEFIFDNYVREKLPLITSMVLFKHAEPVVEGYSNYFNIPKIKNLNKDVAPSATYMWQAYDPSNGISTDGVWNTTRKYNEFVTAFKNNKQNFINDSLGGSINISAGASDTNSYTDDSATLYLINKDVFTSSFTPYAAAATYKFNNLAFGTTDSLLPTATEFSLGLNDASGAVIPGTEIMSNFMKNTTGTKGYFQLPEINQSILNSQGDWIGKYNGIKEIADTVNITGTPFILARNSAGVHIIGIDRYDAMAAAGSYDGIITEIKNTLKWRNMISQNKDMVNYPGFTIDLATEISTYYDENKNEILFKYILKNQTTPPTNKKKYIFSNEYSDMKIPVLIKTNVQTLLEAYYDYKNYSKNEKLNSTVISKIEETQKPYIGKWANNEVLVNGIAGILPFTRTETAGEQFGEYTSINHYDETGKSFSNKELLNRKKIYFDAAQTFYSSLTGDEAIVQKTLTFSSAKYNQYFLIGDSKPTSNDTFADEGNKLNSAIGIFLQDSANVQKIFEGQKILADIGPDILDMDPTSTNYLGFKHSSAPTIGTTDFINSQIQKTYDQQIKLSKYINGDIASSALMSIGNWKTYDELINLVNAEWSETMKIDIYSMENIDYYKEVMGIKYAFDYDETTKEYTFKKFRDFLLRATDNYNKAAFVWTNTNYKDALVNYGVKTVDDFTFKTNPIMFTKKVNGYSYFGEEKILLEKGKYDGSKVTFNDQIDYFNIVPTTTTSTIPYTGFSGMQFADSYTIDPSLVSSLFSNKINIAEDDGTFKTKGTLYNLGSIEPIPGQPNTAGRIQLINKINNIANWNQVYLVSTWLNTQFSVDTTIVDTEVSLSKAITSLVDIVKDTTIINDDQFERIVTGQIANNSKISQMPSEAKFFGKETKVKQMVATQFNRNDVIQLFDTNNDFKINEEDIGFNWTIAANGFLGSSAEAFFFSAFKWNLSETTYKSLAEKNMMKKQGKIDTYDRRLNDSLGEKWVENYKKSM